MQEFRGQPIKRTELGDLGGRRPLERRRDRLANCIVFARWEPNPGEAVISSVIGGDSGDGIGLVLMKRIFGGREISTRERAIHH